MSLQVRPDFHLLPLASNTKHAENIHINLCHRHSRVFAGLPPLKGVPYRILAVALDVSWHGKTGGVVEGKGINSEASLDLLGIP